MTKGNFIIIIVISIVISVVMFFSGFIIGKTVNKEKKCVTNNNNPVVATKNDDREQIAQLTQEQTSIYDLFNKYGKEIYNNNKYNNLSKDGKTPYASLLDLQKLGYDVSKIENICESHSPAIYFDIYNEFAASYEEEPLQIILDCYKIK